MKALNIIETAYRATLEEQDDVIVWLTHAMKGAGAELDVLLRGNAFNYAAKAQEVGRLAFGERVQKHGLRITEDVAGLIGKDIDVYIVAEDLDERGLAADELIDGLKPVARADLPGLFEGYDHVWHWQAGREKGANPGVRPSAGPDRHVDFWFPPGLAVWLSIARS